MGPYSQSIHAPAAAGKGVRQELRCRGITRPYAWAAMQENPPGVHIHQANLSKRLALFPAGLIYRTWVKTLRLRIDESAAKTLRGEPRGAFFVAWHNRAFLPACLHRRFRPVEKRLFGLVSASRDGAWLSAVFEQFGVATVRGSSSRRGASAMREILRIVRAGHDIGITLDGPRGPAYTAKQGIGLLVRETGAPVFYVVPCYRSAWRLRSWDRFFVPKPFSRVDVRLDFQPDPAADFADMNPAAAGQAVGERLRRLTAGTDPAMGV
ncbi:MAG: lysophospholipid acyltransferase family protein [Opitutales bacterium]|nr:lysophospholipid acyltransferase family protein [Opitutales bacterium]